MKKFKSEVKTFLNTPKGVQEYLQFLKTLELMPVRYNRAVKRAHARKMAQSVKLIGVRRTVVVFRTSCFDGVERLVIGDGQHLVTGILNLKSSEIYGNLSIEIIDVKDIADIIPFVSKLNSTAKNWSMREYLNSWVTHGVEDYKFLLTVHEETGFGISPLAEAYSGKRGDGNKAFKDGKFKVKKRTGNKVIDLYRNAVTMGLRDCNSSFLAMVRICTDFPKLNGTKLMYEIAQNPSFGAKTNREFYLALLRGAVRD